VCKQCVTKYQSVEFKWDRYFVNEVKIQLREKPLRGRKTQKFHYLNDKASNKAVTHTYPDAAIVPCTLTHNPMWMLPNQVSYLKESSMDSFSLELLPKLDFVQTRNTHRVALKELPNFHNFYLNTLSKL
jgi:hypothetical protein